jgi:O-antigen/teichoic acid export membrane protein
MLKQNLIANYLGQGWVALMNLAFVPLYIKYLGIEAYGLIGIFAVLQAWLNLLDMGITPTLGREMALFMGGKHTNESILDLLRSIEIIAIGVALVISVTVACGANWIATNWLQVNDLDTVQVTQALAIMGLVIAFRFVEGVYRSAIVGLQRQVLFNGVNSAMATLRGLGAVGIVVWVSPTIKAFFLWQGVVSIITLIILGSTIYATLPQGSRSGRFSLEALSGVWRFAGGMLGITFLALLLTQVDKILLSRILPLSEFGYYSLAATIAASLSILISPITQAFYPNFCELYAIGDQVTLTNNYHKSAQLVSVVAGSAAMVLIFFSETLLQLWTQDNDLASHAALLLSLLTLGNLLNGLMWIPYQMQLAHGWTSLAIKVNIVSVALLVPAIFWTVPHHGAEGAAWIWISLNTGYCLIAAQFMYRRILTSEKWRWYKQDVLLPLGSAGMMVGMIRFLWPVQETVISQILVLSLASIGALSSSCFSSHFARQQVSLNLKPLLKRVIAKTFWS